MPRKHPAGVDGGGVGPQDGSRRLLEFCTSAGVAVRCDRERSVIHGVKILGRESRNGRSYTLGAMSAAAKLYEGKPVNVDHVNGDRRSYRDRIGRLSGIQIREDGLYGDLAVNPKHPLAEQLFWDAEHAPENVGLSHDAQGKTAVRGGKVIVEAVETVRSVDLVAEPATTRGLYEGVEADADAATATAEPPADEDKAAASTPVDKLPDDAFALVLPGGVRIGERTHPLHKRWWPLDTKERVQRAMREIEANRKLTAGNRERALQRARAAAKRFHVTQNQQESLMNDIEKLTLDELKESRPDLVAELQAAGESEKQLVAMKEERDAAMAKLATIERKEKVLAELKEAKIDAEKVPASFMESLLTATDEKRKPLVEDLTKLIGGQQRQQTPAGKPESHRGGGELAASYEDRLAAWK